MFSLNLLTCLSNYHALSITQFPHFRKLTSVKTLVSILKLIIITGMLARRLHYCRHKTQPVACLVAFYKKSVRVLLILPIGVVLKDLKFGSTTKLSLERILKGNKIINLNILASLAEW